MLPPRRKYVTVKVASPGKGLLKTVLLRIVNGAKVVLKLVRSSLVTDTMVPSSCTSWTSMEVSDGTPSMGEWSGVARVVAPSVTSNPLNDAIWMSKNSEFDCMDPGQLARPRIPSKRSPAPLPRRMISFELATCSTSMSRDIRVSPFDADSSKLRPLLSTASVSTLTGMLMYMKLD